MNVCQKKVQKNRFPVHVEDNDNQMSDKQKSAYIFNNYFTNIEKNLDLSINIGIVMCKFTY